MILLLDAGAQGKLKPPQVIGYTARFEFVKFASSRSSGIKIVFLLLLVNFWTSTYAAFFDPSIAALEKRIAPIGKVKIVSSLTKKQLSPLKIDAHLGKALFESKCILCHGNGIAGAPRLGNKIDWKLRIKKKLSLLLKHVTTGYHAMPPKGACLECSAADLEKAINYMLAQVHS